MDVIMFNLSVKQKENGKSRVSDEVLWKWRRKVYRCVSLQLKKKNCILSKCPLIEDEPSVVLLNTQTRRHYWAVKNIVYYIVDSCNRLTIRTIRTRVPFSLCHLLQKEIKIKNLKYIRIKSTPAVPRRWASLVAIVQLEHASCHTFFTHLDFNSYKLYQWRKRILLI